MALTKAQAVILFFIVDSTIQCASFYFERIDLALKLRIFLPKWRWSWSFSVKKWPHKFSDIDPSNLIISWFTHFQHNTLNKKSNKQPILQH